MSNRRILRNRSSETNASQQRRRKLSSVKEEITPVSSTRSCHTSRPNHTRTRVDHAGAPTAPTATAPPIDLKKEYMRFCKLYSSEPLEIVSTPLERASFGRDPVLVDLKGRGLRGVDCIALGKILAAGAPISHLNLSDCLLLAQGFQALVEGLAKNPFLETLELRGNNIQGVMAVALGHLLHANSSLKRLLLEWNCLGVSKSDFTYFCNGLASNTNLEELDLRSNQINAEDAVELAAALHKNKSVKVLDLRWNSIGVAGAKSIWDSLRTNFVLEKIQLCGNFIPDEVVCYIEQCLSHHKEREKMMEDFASRTTYLTRQLQEAEEEFRHELNTVVKIYDAEEIELKDALEKATMLAEQAQAKLVQEVERKKQLGDTIESLKLQLQQAHETEAQLLEAIDLKEEHISHLESMSEEELKKKDESHKLQLSLLQDNIDGLRNSLAISKDKISHLEESLKEKQQDCEMLEKALSAAKDANMELRHSFEEKMKTEREKWMNWKSGLDSTEKYEIRHLEEELKQIQVSMISHIREIEKEKVDAESKARQLEVELATTKSKHEQEMAALRNRMKSEHSTALQRYTSEVKDLNEDKDRLEQDLNKLNLNLQKLQSEKGQLERLNEHAKKKMNIMEEELRTRSDVDELEKEILELKKSIQELQIDKQNVQDENFNLKQIIRQLEKKIKEKDIIIAASLSRAKSEVKELTELLTSSLT